jgi:tetratricopeptide (TPR) repeat protein
VKSHASASGAIVVAHAPEPSADAGATKDTPESVGLPRVDFGAPGPLEIKGYPAPLELGMKDYATAVGFSKDASEVIACGSMSPMAAANVKWDTCFFRRLGSRTTDRAGTEDGKSGPAPSAALAAHIKALEAGSIVELARKANAIQAPPVKTTWAYAKDMVVSVAQGDDGALRIGGVVTGRDAVHPITMRMVSAVPDQGYSAAWNAILPSPDNTELAFVGHFFCMEWCNQLLIERVSHGKLASHVYNDTGYALHQKKDYAGSRDLFLKAAWADPRAPLPPYNLACAYAVLGEGANAEKALRLAIAVGGDKIKARAKRDADFKGVLAQKWFVDLTR